MNKDINRTKPNVSWRLGETGDRPGPIGVSSCHGPNIVSGAGDVSAMQLMDALTWDHQCLPLVVLVIVGVGL